MAAAHVTGLGTLDVEDQAHFAAAVAVVGAAVVEDILRPSWAAG
jgi:hypothetical protein